MSWSLRPGEHLISSIRVFLRDYLNFSFFWGGIHVIRLKREDIENMFPICISIKKKKRKNKKNNNKEKKDENEKKNKINLSFAGPIP